MRKYFVIAVICFFGVSIYLYIKRRPNLPPPSYRPVDGAHVVLDNIDEYKPTWRGTAELFNTLLGMGYLKIEINNLQYEYYCPHCESIPEQGNDPLVLSKMNLGYDLENPEPYYIDPMKQYDFDQIHEWCTRNQGKYPIIYFGDGVKFNVVEMVIKLFNEHGLKFYLNTFEDDYTGMKFDLLNNSPEARKTEESKRVGLTRSEAEHR